MSRAFLAALVLFAAPTAAEAQFFAGVADLPLAPGLSEIATGFGFEGDGGRLVLAEAEGDAAPEAVRAFYLATLPALGWSHSPEGEGMLVFLRGRERLTLTIAGDGGRARLSARLAVLPASMRVD